MDSLQKEISITTIKDQDLPMEHQPESINQIHKKHYPSSTIPITTRINNTHNKEHTFKDNHPELIQKII